MVALDVAGLHAGEIAENHPHVHMRHLGSVQAGSAQRRGGIEGAFVEVLVVRVEGCTRVLEHIHETRTLAPASHTACVERGDQDLDSARSSLLKTGE